MSNFYDPRDMETANVAKEVIIGALYHDGKLAPGVNPEELCSEYAIVVHAGTWLGKIWTRIWGTIPEGSQVLTAVRRVNSYIAPAAVPAKPKKVKPLSGNRKAAVAATKAKQESEPDATE